MDGYNMEYLDRFESGGGGGFFSLKNDGDHAVVRFMYEGGLPFYVVHKIELSGKTRYINCLSGLENDHTKCPLCMAKYTQFRRFFVHIYEESKGAVMIWDRGIQDGRKIAGYCNRYAPIVSTPFEITREGRPGDPRTTYDMMALQKDNTTLDALPMTEPILGGLVLDKSAQDITYYMHNGDFPQVGERNPAQDMPPQRRPQQAQRRTPANVSPQQAQAPHNAHIRRRPERIQQAASRPQEYVDYSSDNVYHDNAGYNTYDAEEQSGGGEEYY